MAYYITKKAFFHLSNTSAILDIHHTIPSNIEKGRAMKETKNIEKPSHLKKYFKKEPSFFIYPNFLRIT
jgi:hypothetical protein